MKIYGKTLIALLSIAMCLVTVDTSGFVWSLGCLFLILSILWMSEKNEESQ